MEPAGLIGEAGRDRARRGELKDASRREAAVLAERVGPAPASQLVQRLREALKSRRAWAVRGRGLLFPGPLFGDGRDVAVLDQAASLAGDVTAADTAARRQASREITTAAINKLCVCVCLILGILVGWLLIYFL